MRQLPLPVLTMAALEGDDWEPALSFPLPAQSDSALLFKVRDQVIVYLEWVMCDGLLAQDPEWVRREIGRACARLIHIADVLPAILDAESQANLKRQREEADTEYYGGGAERQQARIDWGTVSAETEGRNEKPPRLTHKPQGAGTA